MPDSEFQEKVIDSFKCLNARLDIMSKSLQSCQSHCHVDNPSSWRSFFRSIKMLIVG